MWYWRKPVELLFWIYGMVLFLFNPLIAEHLCLLMIILKGTDKNYKNHTEWALHWKRVFVNDYIYACREALIYLDKENGFVLIWPNITNSWANLEHPVLGLLSKIANDVIGAYTRFRLWLQDRGGLTEFKYQCLAALHRIRIGAPNWQSNFIANYTKNCEKNMKTDERLYFN